MERRREMNNLTLNNGKTIPQIGFGTAAIGGWQRNDRYVKDVILSAINEGYRHIDTASVYGNERSVGRAMEESGFPREEFFITTKIWETEQGPKQTLNALHNSLQRLQIDYVDLYLIHWPNPLKTQDTWREMEDIVNEGLAMSLGLSNFRQSDIEHILGFCKYRPTYNQLEIHPYLQQRDLTAYCNSKDIVVACWSPLGSGSWSGAHIDEKPISDQRIKAIAEKHDVSIAQVILKWDLQKGLITIPKSETPSNIKTNLQLDQFELSDDEMRAMNCLEKGLRFGGDPDTALETIKSIAVPA